MKKQIKKKSRNASDTRSKILNIAFMEIFVHGFQGVSIDQIVVKTGLTKGAFFHHFHSKQALGYAIVDETLSEMTVARWIHPLEEFENPIHGIITVLKRIIDTMPEEHLGLGCPLNNLVQEMSSVDPIFRDKLRDVLELWISGIEKHLKRAKINGYLKKEVNPRRVAEFIVMNHEGAFGITKSIRDRKVFKSLHASLKTYLESLCS